MNYNLELKKIEIEKERFALEKEKLEFEKKESYSVSLVYFIIFNENRG